MRCRNLRSTTEALATSLPHKTLWTSGVGKSDVSNMYQVRLDAWEHFLVAGSTVHVHASLVLDCFEMPGMPATPNYIRYIPYWCYKLETILFYIQQCKDVKAIRTYFDYDYDYDCWCILCLDIFGIHLGLFQAVPKTFRWITWRDIMKDWFHEDVFFGFQHFRVALWLVELHKSGKVLHPQHSERKSCQCHLRAANATQSCSCCKSASRRQTFHYQEDLAGPAGKKRESCTFPEHLPLRNHKKHQRYHESAPSAASPSIWSTCHESRT